LPLCDRRSDYLLCRGADRSASGRLCDPHYCLGRAANIPVGDVSPCLDLVEPCPPEVVKIALALIAALVETVYGDKPEALHTPNLVEVFFGIVTRQAFRRGTFTSVPDLITTISTFINGWNERWHPIHPDQTSRQPTSGATH
jgi:hypothetical protein